MEDVGTSQVLSGRPEELETRLLRTFVTILEEGTFTRTAHMLGVSQQQVSNNVRRLEAMLGVSLFDRGASGVTATAWATKILPHALRILKQTEELFLELKEENRPVRLAEIRSRKMMQTVWREFKRSQEDGLVTFTDMTGNEQKAALLAGELDVAMHFTTDPHPELIQNLFRLDPVKVLYTKELSEVDVDSMRLAVASGGARYTSWRNFCFDLGSYFGLTLEPISHDITMLEAIGQGMIEGQIPPLLVLSGMSDYAESDHFYFHDIQNFQAYYPWTISMRKNESRSEIKAFYETALRVSEGNGWQEPVRPDTFQWVPEHTPANIKDRLILN